MLRRRGDITSRRENHMATEGERKSQEDMISKATTRKEKCSRSTRFSRQDGCKLSDREQRSYLHTFQVKYSINLYVIYMNF